MSHTRAGSWIALIVMSAFAMLGGCAKDANGPASKAPTSKAPTSDAPASKAPTSKAPAVKSPAPCSALFLPAANAAIPAGQSQFVTKWTVLGPISFAATDFGGDPQTTAIDKEFMPKEDALDGTQAPPAGSKAAWTVKDFKGAETDGMISLDTMYGDIDHAAVYAVACVMASEEIKDVNLLVGSDDYIKVWINGKLVHKYNTARRAGEPDQGTAPGITLKKGPNRIVVKCVDIVMDWNFFLRFTTKDSKPIGVKAE